VDRVLSLLLVCGLYAADSLLQPCRAACLPDHRWEHSKACSGPWVSGTVETSWAFVSFGSWALRR